MPTVPRREEGPVGDGQPLNFSPIRTTAEAFGGGKASLAPGIAKATKDASDLFTKIFDEANETAIQKAENSFMEGRIGLENEFLQMQGEDAVGFPGDKESASAKFQTRLTQLRSESASNLSGLQAHIFNPRADKQSIQATSRIERHVSEQSMILSDKTDMAGIKLNHMNAIRDYTSAFARNTAIDNIDIKLRKIADRKGYSKEQASLARVETISNVHRGVIEQYLKAKQTGEAKGYFNGIGGVKSGEMTASDSSTIKKMIVESTFLGKVQQQSDQIMRKHGHEPRVAMITAHGVTDPDERKAVENEVKTRLAEDAHFTKLENTEGFNDVWNAVRNGADIRNFTVAMEGFEPRQKKSLDDYAQEVRTGSNRDTNFPFFHDLKLMASDPKTAKAFLKVNLKDKWKYLGEDQLNQLLDIQAGMLKSSGKTVKALDGYMTTHQIVNNFANEVGIDTRSSASTKNRKKMSALRFEADRQIVDLQTRMGRQATNAEITAIVGSLVRVQNAGWFTNDFAFESTATDSTIDVDDIPNSLRQRIERSMQENNIQVTDEAIIENFMAIQGQIRGTSK